MVNCSRCSRCSRWVFEGDQSRSLSDGGCRRSSLAASTSVMWTWHVAHAARQISPAGSRISSCDIYISSPGALPHTARSPGAVQELLPLLGGLGNIIRTFGAAMYCVLPIWSQSRHQTVQIQCKIKCLENNGLTLSPMLRCEAQEPVGWRWPAWRTSWKPSWWRWSLTKMFYSSCRSSNLREWGSEGVSQTQSPLSLCDGGYQPLICPIEIWLSIDYSV